MARVCKQPGCPNLEPCTDHPKPSWPGRNGTTSRQARGITDSGWREQSDNQRILKAHGYRCYLCGAKANQVDHVIPRMDGGPHTDANRRPICDDCHTAKSKAEAARARRIK